MTNNISEKVRNATKIGGYVALASLLVTVLTLLAGVSYKVFCKDTAQDVLLTRHDEKINTHGKTLDKHDKLLMEQRTISAQILSGIEDLKDRGE